MNQSKSFTMSEVPNLPRSTFARLGPGPGHVPDVFGTCSCLFYVLFFRISVLGSGSEYAIGARAPVVRHGASSVRFGFDPTRLEVVGIGVVSIVFTFPRSSMGYFWIYQGFYIPYMQHEVF